MSKKLESKAFNTNIVSNLLHQVNHNLEKKSSFFSALLLPYPQDNNHIHNSCYNSEFIIWDIVGIFIQIIY